MDNRELIDIASKGEWTLECDRKVLEMMQTLASKIENRATSTKGKMNEMALRLDHTKVKMSNLTRINDIKNTVYCENLITDDHLEQPINEVPKNTVKLSTNVAIQNGLKLMENCFEKHRVSLDPSDNPTKISTVYRPIDKFYTPLPYLIGEKNWKEKWHLGLIEEDKHSQAGSMYAESVESNITPSSRVESVNLLASESNLLASQTSLSKSNSSIGDQMTINKQDGLFDEIYPVEQTAPSIIQPPTSSSFFAPQKSERKIVNLFDDEPPELTVESSQNRRQVNLFDDVDSVISMPIPDVESFDKTLPPVDLFNDNEFDSFIKKMEKDPQKVQHETLKVKSANTETEMPINKENIMKDESKENMQRDIHKNIAAEIKNVHLRKVENLTRTDNTVTKTVQHTQPEKKVVEKEASSKQETNKSAIKELIKKESQESRSVTEQTESKVIANVKTRTKITNLFDDDESEDFFDEIIKQRAQKNTESKTPQIRKAEPIVQKPISDKKKTINLFDDEDDDEFDNIFNKKLTEPATPKVEKNLNISSKINELEKAPSNTHKSYQKTNEPFPSQIADKIIVNKQKTLYDDDSVNNLLRMQSEDFKKSGQESAKLDLKESDSEQIKSDLSTTIVDNNETESTEAIKTLSGNDLQNDNAEIKINQSMENINNEEDLLKSKKSIIANYKEDNDNLVPNTAYESEKENEFITSPNRDQTKLFADNSTSRIPEIKEFSNPVLFLSDEPPDYFDNWDTEDNNYEEPEERETFSRNTSNYLAFNDVPPEDDDFTGPMETSVLEKPHIEEDFNGFLSHKSTLVEQEVENESLPPQIPDLVAEMNEASNKSNLESPKPIQTEKNIQAIISANADSADNLKPSKLVAKSSNEIEEKDPNLVKSSIKSKLDIFSKSQEPQTSAQQTSPPKKLPGKLNSNLKINVGALMPGARLPKIVQDNDDSFDNFQSIEELDSSNTEKLSTENSSNSGLLNNDLTKMRAKIQVKRRPSTRKGRRSIYEKTLSVNIDEDENVQQDLIKEEKEKTQFDNETKHTDIKSPKIMQTSTLSNPDLNEDFTPKNEATSEIYESHSFDTKLSQNIFESKSIENIHGHKQIKVQSNILDFSDDEPPPLDNVTEYEKKIATTVTSRSRIFYDDEDETRKMLEEEKKRNEEVRANQNSSLWLFDKSDENDQFDFIKSESSEKNNQISKELADSSKKAIATSLFDDDSDNDLFPTTSKVVQKPKKVEAPKSLFNDSDEFDLFGESKKKTESKSTKLFDSDEDNKLEGSIIFSKSINSSKPKNQSIFGDDDDDDDDDLFSSKPKTNLSTTTPVNSKKTTSSAVKKTTSTVINDPLKDLLEN